MKRQLLFGLILAGVGVLSACNSDSPTAPPATPTPTAYSMVLTATPGQQEVGGSILFQATVSAGSGVAPDGTSVTFTVSGCVPGGASDPAFENGTCEIVRTTSAGRATATLTSNTAGSFQVVARVPQREASTVVTFRHPTTPRDLAIYSITPNRGRPEGGEQVTIRGRGFAAPVTVAFRVGGSDYEARVLSVSADGAQIQAVTPAMPQNTTDERVADLVVTAGAGTGAAATEILANGFTFERPVSEPRIYSLQPSRGAWSGGEQVRILGANFFAPVRVFFGAEEAEVASVSADRTQVVVLTPRHSGSITEEQTVAVTVRTRAETIEQQVVTLANAFTYVPDSGDPVLYAVNPARGTPRGGEQVTLTGKNFTAPILVEFLFSVDGVNKTLPAEAVAVNPAGTQITLRTPQASPTPVTTDVPVSLRITNLVGAANSRNATFTNVFTYIGESRPPLIYYLQPDRGSARGGEQVVLYGRFLLPPVRVTFTPGGDAEVTNVSADGERVTLITPAVSVQPLAQDTPATITVTSQYGTGRETQATLANGFLYIAEQPTPEIYALTPNSGPIEGGTRVTITGRGFQYPVEVTFEYPEGQFRQAQVVSVNFTTVVCLSPSVAPSQPETPALANVRVTNVTTGRQSNALPFRYGEALFISAISPNRGSDRGGDQVTLYGQGFSPPVTVTLAGVPAEPLTVGGTLIVARTGRVPNRGCSPRSGPSEVVNINSNLRATGPNYTYNPATPFVTSVSVVGTGASGNTLPAPGTPCSSGTYVATVNGFDFEQLPGGLSGMRAVLGTTPPVEVATTWVSENQLTFTFPDLSGFTFNQVPCVEGGASGVRYVPTAVNLTLTNLQNSCSDTLNGAFIFNPCDTSCRITTPPTLTLTPGSLTISAGTQGTMTVTLSQAQLVATTVSLVSSAPSVASVPATVTIPAGLTSATFQVTGVSPGPAVSITATVSLPGVTPANANVTVTPMSVSLSPASVTITGPVGSTANFSVVLGANVASPVTVTLTSSNPAAVAVPTSVTVAANTNTATFQATKAGTSTSPVTVAATLPAALGGGSATATVNVPPLALTLTVPSSVIAGSSVQATVSLTWAQTTSTVVQLTSSNPAWASVPASVTIAANTTSVTFPVTGVATTSPAPSVNITASIPAIPAVSPVTVSTTVNPMTISLSPSSATLGGPPGSTVTLTVTLGATAAGPITVNLVSTNTGAATVPATVTVAASTTSASFQVTKVAVGSTTVQANLPGGLNPAAPPHASSAITVVP